MSDFVIACIIVGSFLLFLGCVFAYGIIVEKIAEERDRHFYVGKSMPKGVWVFAEPED